MTLFMKIVHLIQITKYKKSFLQMTNFSCLIKNRVQFIRQQKPCKWLGQRFQSLLFQNSYTQTNLTKYNFLNINLINIYRFTARYYIYKKDMQKGKTFFTFEEFVDELGSWKPYLKTFCQSKTFQDIYKFCKEQYQAGKKIYPPKQDIFSAFKKTPIDSIKAVIVGQDPYHQPNQAHGLCFSVLKPVPPPPSLKNIYKNLAADKSLNFKIPNHGDLSHWAEQGVFMLNATLTVEDSQPNSHAKCGWQKFTSQVINVINKQCKNVVFFLWGKPAQQKAKNADGKKHLLLKTSHPSPLSFKNGFQTSKHFSACNQYLKQHGKSEIDWQIS